MFHGKFAKSESFLTVLWEHVIFNVNWVEVRKMTEILWAKLYYKTTDLFWLWDFLLEDLKFKKLWWCPKKVACPKKYIQKTNTKDEILNHSYFGPNFVFGGTVLVSIFFSFFSFRRRQTMEANIFTEPPTPTIKKLPTAMLSRYRYSQKNIENSW